MWGRLAQSEPSSAIRVSISTRRYDYRADLGTPLLAWLVAVQFNSMHNNPAKRKLVNSPDQWAWSSFRFYFLNDSSVLTMDRLA